MDSLLFPKPVGLKLDISPEIMPRDTSFGTKIFTLVPNGARNVREVKAYFANFVLKTPTPFQLFVGEYRIREEEDVQIFSLIDEPCKLVPVPMPRPALSTPKNKTVSAENPNGSGGSSKRVTFFDADLSASPVEYAGVVNNGLALDVLDHSHSRSPRPSTSFPVTSTPNRTGHQVAHNDGEKNEDELEEEDIKDASSEERKKRRRRKRSRRSKSDARDQIKTEAGELASTPPLPTSSSEQNGNSIVNSKKSQSLDPVNEETESDEEVCMSQKGVSQDFEFATPNALPKGDKRVNQNQNESSIPGPDSKRQKLSDSAFSTPGSFVSPDSRRSTSSGKRQDTPIVPRIVRNPKAFESARKIINDFKDIKSEDFMSPNEDHQNNSVGNDKVHNASPVPAISESTCENGNPSKPITNSGDVNVGDKLAFQVLELDECYNPVVSQIKEGTLIERNGEKLTIQLTKNQIIVRNGKYEIPSEDPAAGEDVDSNLATLMFTELIEPKLISSSPLTALSEN